MEKSKINTEMDYNATMKKIDALMKKGENNLTNKEAEELKSLALAAQVYEKKYLHYPGSEDFGRPDRIKNV